LEDEAGLFTGKLGIVLLEIANAGLLQAIGQGVAIGKSEKRP
jgi:hypothetical protein